MRGGPRPELLSAQFFPRQETGALRSGPECPVGRIPRASSAALTAPSERAPLHGTGEREPTPERLSLSGAVAAPCPAYAQAAHDNGAVPWDRTGVALLLVAMAGCGGH